MKRKLEDLKNAYLERRRALFERRGDVSESSDHSPRGDVSESSSLSKPSKKSDESEPLFPDVEEKEGIQEDILEEEEKGEQLIEEKDEQLIEENQ